MMNVRLLKVFVVTLLGGLMACTESRLEGTEWYVTEVIYKGDTVYNWEVDYDYAGFPTLEFHEDHQGKVFTKEHNLGIVWQIIDDKLVYSRDTLSNDYLEEDNAYNESLNEEILELEGDEVEYDLEFVDTDSLEKMDWEMEWLGFENERLSGEDSVELLRWYKYPFDIKFRYKNLYLTSEETVIVAEKWYY